ncbi:HAD family hydrolase [uncultured Ilyobacter sp.]|uniref:HAD family hydrolase n=1 Tax=uncultured Ilyobacter sp. TaxID=544433 RepID=UPI002AA7BBA6|nr:HAD family hydrolase [uncultured Ilyobacter sp.]
MIKNIKVIIFDWGDTLMRDYDNSGPMAHWKKVALIPGIKDVLRELEKNYTLCVASNAGESDSELMKSALKRVGIDNFFSYFFTSKDLGFEKPDIRFYETILKSESFSANECLMVGNHYDNDIVGSKSIGMTTILFDENNKFSDTESADYKINRIIQILDILRS